MGNLDKEIEGFKGRFEVIYRYTIPTEEDTHKDEKFRIVGELLDKTDDAAESALKDTFMDEPSLFTLYALGDEGIEFVIFLCTKYYNKHIGNLIEEQQDEELCRAKCAIWKKLFVPIASAMLNMKRHAHLDFLKNRGIQDED